MKTIKNPLSAADSASSDNTFKPILYNHLIGKAVLGILIAFFAAACHPSPQYSTLTPQGSGKPTRNSTSANPDKPTGNQSGGSIRVFNTLKISSASTDFQEIQADAQGIPVRSSRSMTSRST